MMNSRISVNVGRMAASLLFGRAEELAEPAQDSADRAHPSDVAHRFAHFRRVVRSSCSPVELVTWTVMS